MMKFFTALSLATGILAQSGTCPDGNGASSYNGYSFCCPSNFVSSDQNGAYCVLGCTVGFEPCFPFCTADGTTNAQTTKGTCTSVPVTASDYSSLVGYSGNAVATATANSVATTNSAVVQTSSASVNTFVSTSAGAGTSPGAASTTVASTQPTAVTGSAITQQSSAGTQTTSASSTSVSHGMAAVVTAAPLLIAGALAGIVFA